MMHSLHSRQRPASPREGAQRFARLLRRAWICALPALFVLLAGCERSVPRTDYFPLRDGNRWDYRLLDMPLLKRLADGQPIQTSRGPTDIATAQPAAEPVANSEGDLFRSPDDPPAPAEGRRVARASPPESAGGDARLSPTGGDARPTSKENSSTARRVTLEMRDSINDLTFRARYDALEQVWSKKNGYIGFQSGRGRSYLLILPPHTSYRWVVTSAAGQDLYFEVESAAASIQTPAGTFKNCALARQESRDRKEVFRYWFAPDVGLVRRSKYFLNEEVFRQELVDYEVKPALPGVRLAEQREVERAVAGKNHGSEFRERPAAKESYLDRIDAQENTPRADKIQKYSEPR